MTEKLPVAPSTKPQRNLSDWRDKHHIGRCTALGVRDWLWGRIPRPIEADYDPATGIIYVLSPSGALDQANQVRALLNMPLLKTEPKSALVLPLKVDYGWRV